MSNESKICTGIITESTSYHKLIVFLKNCNPEITILQPNFSRSSKKISRPVFWISIQKRETEDQTLAFLPFKTHNVTNISSPRERHLERNFLSPKMLTSRGFCTASVARNQGIARTNIGRKVESRSTLLLPASVAVFRLSPRHVCGESPWRRSRAAEFHFSSEIRDSGAVRIARNLALFARALETDDDSREDREKLRILRRGGGGWLIASNRMEKL